MKYIHTDNDKRINITKLSETQELNTYEFNNERFFLLELIDLLQDCNINNCYKGYELIIDSCRIFYKNNFGHLLITKDIYLALGKLYEIPAAQVEHAIRTAISCGWREYKKHDKNNEIFDKFDKRPSNNKFLNQLTTLAFRRMRSI